MTYLAVVPIFMSAGAAVFPTILAAMTSVVAVIFKPRELAGLCRRRPMGAGISITVVAMAGGLAAWWITSGMTHGAGRNELQKVIRVDWVQVARDILAQERAGKVPTVVDGAVATGPVATPGDRENPPQTIPSFPTTTSGLPATGPATPLPLMPIVVGRDYARTFYDGGPAPRTLAPIWTYRPEESMFISDPLVVGTRIYVAVCQADLGGYTGLLACLNAETGKPIWQITSAGKEDLKAFFSSPALSADGKYLIIGQGLHEDRNCSLLCLEAATGKLHWAVKTPLHIESSPAIFGDMAVVGAGAIEGKDGRAVGDPGYVLAVRISNGKELWKQAVNDPESTPAIDDKGMVYIGSGLNGNAVVAIRSDSAEELRKQKLERVAWKRAVDLPATGPITLAGDLVIIGSGNGDMVHSDSNPHGMVIALDKKTGDVRWQTAFNDAVLTPIAHAGGMLICGVRNGEVAALSTKDGKILWRKAISGNSPVLAGCAFTGDRVYAVSSDGYLAILDAKDGAIMEKISLNDQAKPGTGLSLSSPQVMDGRVVVGSETGGLQMLVGAAR